ncbi:MAG: class I SAM-dependent methyltransferase, partial [Candidatus Gracilibacteria bacterium]
MSLPIEDKTPENFFIKEENIKEKLKKPLRRFIYPLLAIYKEANLEQEYKLREKLGLDMILANQRGNDYEAHRLRINKYKKLKDSTVLIIGIGTGRDLESWLKYKPKKIISIDYFNYQKAWDMRKKQYKDKYSTKLEFFQADILNMDMIKDNSIDIVGSDAVFEHINKFDTAIKELYRVLKKDGILYSTFGPLWYSWGGDHISGRNNLIDGYNHIKLSKDDYEKYLDSFGEFNHS